MQEKSVELNKETAMRLWNMSFGRESKAVDFAGRTIAKGAYNDRNSEFGWNVDHILPQSKNGKTADYNLICCHISTNDEKADSFPCFNANDRSFEIVKVQRHYEIRERHPKAQEGQKTVNLYDSAAGVRLFKSLNKSQNEERFIGTVFIYLKSVSSDAIVDFIKEVFDKENISCSGKVYQNYLTCDCFWDIKIRISSYRRREMADMESLLDKCVVLNTYLSGYFQQCKCITDYDIYYREDPFVRNMNPVEEPKNFRDLLLPKSLKFELGAVTSIDVINPQRRACSNSLFINERVRINTDARRKVDKAPYSDYMDGYTKYNRVFTKLKENLTKEANGEK